MNAIDQVLDFWFGDPPELRTSLWFRGTAEVDAELRERFEPLVARALAGDCGDWLETPEGAVALLVLLDQLPRNVYRGTERMFVGDTRAEAVLDHLLERDDTLPVPHRAVVYLALTHAERIERVQLGVERFDALQLDPVSRGFRRPLKRMRASARRHLRILRRFGRYPHRNALLGRETTDAEAAWLASDVPRFARSVRPHARHKLKILVLHSFRQSAARLRSRMRALQGHLEDIAELEFIDAPHAYVPDSEQASMLAEDFGEVPDFDHQRCWWNADAEGEYAGCDASLRFLEAHLPADGVLGFSQGGAMAGLLAALHPEGLRFAICISGFPARSEAHAAFMAPGGIDLPSLHVYGERDVLVDHERTHALAACFVAPSVVSHPGGHFFPDLWPRDAIRTFLLPLLLEPPPTPQLGSDAVEVRDLASARAKVEAAEDLPGLLAEARAMRGMGDAAELLWVAASETDPEVVAAAVARDDDFRGLVALARRAVAERPDSGVLLDAIAGRFAEQIRRDEGRAVVSEAGRAAPRRRSLVERETGLGRRIAEKLAPERAPNAVMMAYRRRVVALSARLKLHERRRHRRRRAPAASDTVSVEVTRPRPVPVLPAPAAELEPLLCFLRDGRVSARPAAFPRGTLMPDGRLDLCKQVVGPGGIGPLLGALEDHPQVQRLLLGNNVVGPTGAERIAAFLRSGSSRVKVWYIAGNEIDAAGLGPICEALHEAPEVEGLWLKRNPLGPAAGAPLSALLRADTALQTLDLVNTGLLDEGAHAVVEALWANHHLRHLYLGTNGLTQRTAELLARYLAEVDRLESLYIDCNRLGDAGVAALCRGLAESRSLRRLSLASNRIGPLGARLLCDALAEHTGLAFLDLGWTRATSAVQEGGNHLGDEGAEAVGALLRTSDLRVLDVSHNHISQRGLDHLRAALEANTALVGLRCPQRGKATNPDSMALLRGLVERNRQAAGLDAGGVDAIRTPRPAHEILSVYRTRPLSA